MHDELTARQRAISLRLAGRSVKHICSALARGAAWFHRWWRRYLEAGPTRGWEVIRWHSTAEACGCRSCPRASRCRRGGCRWQRGV
jgi:hypothetical protein